LCVRVRAVSRPDQERCRGPPRGAAVVRPRMSAREKLLGWLDAERERQVEFLQAFTRIDTCNPPGDTREAADIFRRFLDAEGVPHRTEAPQAAMPNLVSSFTGMRAGRHLVLNGHLD